MAFVCFISEALLVSKDAHDVKVTGRCRSRDGQRGNVVFTLHLPVARGCQLCGVTFGIFAIIWDFVTYCKLRWEYIDVGVAYYYCHRLYHLRSYHNTVFVCEYRYRVNREARLANAEVYIL